MKRVIIEIRKGKPHVISCPNKIEVIFRTPKKRSFRKVMRTWAYRIKTLGR
jgi:hypothetical protein